MSNEKTQYYNILLNKKKIHMNLTEEEYFDIMENLSVKFYQTGSPNPKNIDTEIIRDLR